MTKTINWSDNYKSSKISDNTIISYSEVEVRYLCGLFTRNNPMIAKTGTTNEKDKRCTFILTVRIC